MRRRSQGNVPGFMVAIETNQITDETSQITEGTAMQGRVGLIILTITVPTIMTMETCTLTTSDMITEYTADK